MQEIRLSPVEVGCLSHYLQGFCTSHVVQDSFHQQYDCVSVNYCYSHITSSSREVFLQSTSGDCEDYIQTQIFCLECRISNKPEVLDLWTLKVESDTTIGEFQWVSHFQNQTQWTCCPKMLFRSLSLSLTQIYWTSIPPVKHLCKSFWILSGNT